MYPPCTSRAFTARPPSKALFPWPHRAIPAYYGTYHRSTYVCTYWYYFSNPPNFAPVNKNPPPPEPSPLDPTLPKAENIPGLGAFLA